MTDVELVKSKTDIVSLISEFVSLKKAGRHFKANCPFHSEKSPSFIVSSERQTWHCFGACSTGGDVISFVMRWEHLEFVEALKYLAQRAGVTLSHQPLLSDQGKKKERLYELNHLAAEYYHFVLTKHALGEKAKAYLHERGIKEQIWDTFSLGYAPHTWQSASLFLKKKGYTYEEMEEAGLVLKGQRGGYYDRFRGRLVFALRDHRGNVSGFSGRVLPSLESGDTGAKYINTSETPIYTKGHMLYGLDVTKESIKKAGYGVVVEGEFDILSSYQSGISQVVAIKGTALTDDQLHLLSRYTQDIRLALDSDVAGNEAARKGIEKAEHMGLTVRVIQVPGGKDPAECISSGSHVWKSAVEHAIPVYDFLINSAMVRYDASDISGKKAISDIVIPFLSRISNPIVQSHYQRLLATKLGISEESVQTAIKKASRTSVSVAHMSDVSAPHPLTREKQQEIELLALIFESVSPVESWKKIQHIIDTPDLMQPPVRKIMETFFLYISTHDVFDLSLFTKALSSELLPTFDEAFLMDVSDIVADAELFSLSLHRCARVIKTTSLRRIEEDISTKIKHHDGDERLLESLTKEFQRIRSERLQIEKQG